MESHIAGKKLKRLNVVLNQGSLASLGKGPENQSDDGRRSARKQKLAQNILSGQSIRQMSNGFKTEVSNMN